MTQLFQLTGKADVDDPKYDAALIVIFDTLGDPPFVTGATLFSPKNALAIATKIEKYTNNVENLRALIRDMPDFEYSTDNKIESIKSMKEEESPSSSHRDAVSSWRRDAVSSRHRDPRISVITVSFAQNLNVFN